MEKLANTQGGAQVTGAAEIRMRGSEARIPHRIKRSLQPRRLGDTKRLPSMRGFLLEKRAIGKKQMIFGDG